MIFSIAVIASIVAITSCAKTKEWNHKEREKVRNEIKAYRERAYLRNLEEMEFDQFSNDVVDAIEVDYPILRILAHQEPHQMASYETGPSCYKNISLISYHYIYNKVLSFIHMVILMHRKDQRLLPMRYLYVESFLHLRFVHHRVMRPCCR